MIELIAGFLKVLNSESEPEQISLAFCLAMIPGFTPFFTLHNLFVLLAVLVLRVNLSAILLSFPIFTGISYLLNPMFHSIGMKILTAKSLKPLWTLLYNVPLFRAEKFNNTVVMGSLLVSILLAVPCFFIFTYLIRRYRDDLAGRVKKLKIVETLKASRLYDAYRKISITGGA